MKIMNYSMLVKLHMYLIPYAKAKLTTSVSYDTYVIGLSMASSKARTCSNNSSDICDGIANVNSLPLDNSNSSYSFKP